MSEINKVKEAVNIIKQKRDMYGLSADDDRQYRDNTSFSSMLAEHERCVAEDIKLCMDRLEDLRIQRHLMLDENVVWEVTFQDRMNMYSRGQRAEHTMRISGDRAKIEEEVKKEISRECFIVSVRPFNQTIRRV